MITYSLFDYYASLKEKDCDNYLDDATKFMLNNAKRLTDRLIEARGHDFPPFSPYDYTKLLGIKVEMEDLSQPFGNEDNKSKIKDTSALLIKSNEGYVIKINKHHNYVRQNFSCAHEIGHTLLNEVEPHIQSIEYRTYNPQAAQKARQKTRERLCDIAATELLMPEIIFKKYLLDFGISVNSIKSLANTFKVSYQSAAIRIAELSEKKCITLLWQPKPKNKPKKLRLAWRAGMGIDNKNRINYMPVQENIKPNSTLYKTYQSNNTTKSVKDFKIDNEKKRLRLESKGFGYGENRYVISLAFLDN